MDNPKASSARPRAYSYVRFSTPEQANGDSLERQTKAARAWAAARGLELDEELTFRDEGVSAFLGANAATGALGAFLEAVRAGTVPKASYLLVESLDRISRQAVRKASRTMEDIVEAGVTVVDLSDGGREYSTDALDRDAFLFITMALRFVRANEESTLKSTRVAAAVQRKREKFASDQPLDRPFTRALPAWITWSDEDKGYRLIPERAGLVRRIFELADEGWGQHRIAHWLNETGIECWGKGKRRAAHWHRSYVRKILTNQAVLGTFTPHLAPKDPETKKRVRKPLAPVHHRFPAVVERELFERVGNRVAALAPRGRNALSEPKSIFAGVLKCAHCGSAVVRVSKGEHVYLVCSRANARAKGCRYQAVRYQDAEQALRTNAEAIFELAPRGPNTLELEKKIWHLEEEYDELRDEQDFLTDELVAKRSAALRERLDAIEERMASKEAELRRCRTEIDKLAGPYVLKRLLSVRDSLCKEPLDVSVVNSALKQAVRQIVLDPSAATLTIYWAHASEPDQPVPLPLPRKRWLEPNTFDVGEPT
jgi:DNA invertase Pin-like site-specific DNA recombinase